MASSDGEAYMLPRNVQESQRLEAQHEYMRQLSYGHLIHPSIPIHQLHAVADVATGTGIWLRQLVEDPALPHQQFPSSDGLPPQVSFAVHDMVKPFPTEHHEKFDLVNVRLVSYAIKGKDLEQVVRNVLQLLRPGGYLQWQEADASDTWVHPETPAATSCVNFTIAEKLDRGLLPNIAGPLVKTILSMQVMVPDGQQNILTRNRDLMRLIHLETVSTFKHPSSTVKAGKKAAATSAAVAFLKARIHRKSTMLKDSRESNPLVRKLEEEVEAVKATLETIERGQEDCSWDFDLTWIVARKAIVQDSSKPWMNVKMPSP
ncbi:MAG: hypothetical protein Q9193_002544 [Seirophora villosa]